MFYGKFEGNTWIVLSEKCMILWSVELMAFIHVLFNVALQKKTEGFQIRLLVGYSLYRQLDFRMWELVKDADYADKLDENSHHSSGKFPKK